MSTDGPDPVETAHALLLADVGIGCAMLLAAAWSGSAAMLASTVHLFADAGKSGLLLLGVQLATANPTRIHAFSRLSLGYFWCFFLSALLFFFGGVFAIWEGISALYKPQLELLLLPLAILAVSVALKLRNLRVAFREFCRVQRVHGSSNATFIDKDSAFAQFMLKRGGPMLSLMIASFSVAMTAVTRNPAVDGVGSLLIGLLFCSFGFFLVLETRRLARGVDPETQEQVVALSEGAQAVLGVAQLSSLQVAPNVFLLALKVRLRNDLPLSELKRVVYDIEDRIRAQHPHIKRVLVESDGDHDSSLNLDLDG